jgi:hypothetical protein
LESQIPKLAQYFSVFHALSSAGRRGKARPAAGAFRMPDSNDLLKWPVEWLRIAPPEEVEGLSSLSWDSFVRAYPELVIHLSPRRCGARVGHALMIGVESKIASP